MKYGYARDTGDHDLALQLMELKKEDCQPIITESGQAFSDLNDLLSRMNKGDTLVVWRIDKLANTLTKLDELVEELQRIDVTLCSVVEKFDSSKDSGITKTIIRKLAELEK